MAVWIAFLVEVGLLVVLAYLAWTILVGILSGRIGTAGMLATEAGGAIDPERLLLLAGTIGFAFFYTATALRDGADPRTLPDVSGDVIALLGGGNAVYLVGKFTRLSGRKS